jgi:hypothetical protein
MKASPIDAMTNILFVWQKKLFPKKKIQKVVSQSKKIMILNTLFGMTQKNIKVGK